jgi:hypothetical protein
MKMKMLFAILVYVCASASALAQEQEIVSVVVRSGVTQSYLLLKPKEGTPSAVAVLFPGAAGVLGLRGEGSQAEFRGGNFLVRSREEFVRHGVVAAVMDVPSDLPSGMDDYFRLGSTHTADIRAVVADLKKRFDGVPVFLVGTSRGTISAAAAGKALGDSIAGVVLTATVFLPAGGSRSRSPGLSGFDFSSIRVPLLFVHHVEDECAYTPYRSAKSQASRFALVTISGGEPARSEPCGALSAHGFLGKEKETVDEIVNWMLKKPTAASIVK